MIRGRFRRERALRKAIEGGDVDPARLARLAQEIAESSEERNRRDAQAPRAAVDSHLPIHEAAASIAESLTDHSVIVVTGETGSGKSTQLPLIMLNSGLGRDGFIGHTQPRRIAARGIAYRIAEQMRSPLGRYAGFKTRFADHVDSNAYIKLMTDGILLAEIQSDRFLENYSAVIIDEAHERSLNIDFLLGYLKQLLAKRTDLKVVITSATIDAERFAAHFSGETPVPIIEVSGRSFPIEIRYPADDMALADESVHDAAVAAVLELFDEVSGDGLVFLPTEFDIRSMARQLRGALLARRDSSTEILPLYARLTPEQQNAVFAPHRARRIVLATNVAESSITVPGIRFVIDTGTARISRYAPRSKVQRLPIEPVSRASADQRAGRCGRVGPGICLRLFSESDYAERPAFTTPEIRRTNLASVILRMKSLRLGEVEEFPFIDPPQREATRDGYETLFELQAIDADKQLTSIGRVLGRLPTDPRVARMLLAGEEGQCLNEVAIIAAGLEVPDPRVRPAEFSAQADERHAQWSHPQSDFLSLLNLFDFYQTLKATRSRSQLARECQKNFLSLHHLREWVDVHRQLLAMVGEMGWKIAPRRDDYDAIHQALLCGLLSGIALREERGDYLGAGGIRWRIWPGSALAKQPPAWIVAAEIVETSRRFGRTAAKIQPQWIEPLAGHLLEYAYDEPHWNDSRQTCVAAERASLYGVPVIAKRLVPYAPVDSGHARRVFIEQGLSEGRVQGRLPFLSANAQLLQNAQVWAAKSRNRKFVVDDWTLEKFYEQRLPVDAVDSASLTKLLRASPELDAQLRMSLEDLELSSSAMDERQFPEEVEWGNLPLKLHYRFEPGASDDGINVDVPSTALGHLSQQELDWLVPGRLAEKIAELIRTLPKTLRRELASVGEIASPISQTLVFGKGVFVDAVAQAITKLSGVHVSPRDFQLDKLPDHLRVNIRAVDEKGNMIEQGRDLVALQRKLIPATVSATAAAEEGSKWNQTGWTTWNIEELPEQVLIRRGKFAVPFFPMLREEQELVSLGLSDNLQSAEWHLAGATARLFQIAQQKNIQSQVRWIPELQNLSMAFAPWISSDRLNDILSRRLADLAFIDEEPLIRTKSAFESRLSESARRIPPAVQTIANWVKDFARELSAMRLRFESQTGRLRPEIRSDVEAQLKNLFGEDFLRAPWSWLQQYPRYVAAIATRLDKVTTNLPRDLTSLAEVQRHVAWFEHSKGQLVPGYPIHAGLIEFRWMIEELRVSLFAQQLGTKFPVSGKRLEKLAATLAR